MLASISNYYYYYYATSVLFTIIIFASFYLVAFLFTLKSLKHHVIISLLSG